MDLQLPSIDLNFTSLLGSVLDTHQEPVIQELGQTFDTIFNHSEFLQAECKYFLREFETKRGDEDLQATSALLRQQKLSVSLLDSFAEFELSLDYMNKSLNDMNSEITSFLNEEDNFAKNSSKVIEEITKKREDDQVAYSRDMTAMREEIDTQWKANAEKLEEIYHVPEEIKRRMEERRQQHLQDSQEQNWFGKRLV